MSQFLFNSLASRGVGSAKPAVVVLDGQYAQDAVALGPLAYYRLGEAVGEGDMLDSSGNSRHGSYVGDVLLGQAALCANDGGDAALRLLASADQCVAPTFAASILSISCFVQVPDVSGQHTIAEEDSGQPDDGWSFEILNGKLRAYIRSAPGVGTSQWIGGAVDGPVGYGTLVNNTIHHVILRFGTGGAELWLDGTQLIQDTNLTDGPVANNAQLIIGSYHGQSSIEGFVDEFMVFNRTLDSGEIAQLNDPATTVPAPVAQNDTFPNITEETGNHDFDVLANDSFTGTPSITIVNQTGPGTATVTGAGAASLIRVPTAAVDPGIKTVTYELTNTGGAGSDQAVLTVEIVAAASGPYCSFYTGTANDKFPPTPTPDPDPPPDGNLPGYLVPFIDADTDFPSRIMRITGVLGTAVPNIGGVWKRGGPNDLYIRHYYTKRTSWNADQSVIDLSRNGGMLLDGTSYQPIKNYGSPASHSMWHPVLSDRMIFVTDNRVRYWFWATNGNQTVHTFTGYSSCGFGTQNGQALEAQISADGKYMVIVAIRNSDGQPVKFIYGFDEDNKGADFDVGGTISNVHWSISPSGNYVVRHTDFSCGVWERNGLNRGASLGGSNQPHRAKHRSIVIDLDGKEYIVGNSRENGAPTVIFGAFDDVSPTEVILDSTGNSFHTAPAIPGWTMIGMSSTNGNRAGEAVMMRLDGSVKRRIARMRGNTPYFSAENHPSPSPDGKRFLFASTWDLNASGTLGPLYCFVVETCDYEGQLFA